LESVTKEGLDLVKGMTRRKELADLKVEFEPLTNLVKEVLGDKVAKVVASSRGLTGHAFSPPSATANREHGTWAFDKVHEDGARRCGRKSSHTKEVSDLDDEDETKAL
jgi:HSP90 family molecular chaperone